MGNTYYITRRRKWSCMEGASISEAEWRACVEADSELSPCNGAESAVSWASHDGVFCLERGNIVGKFTDSDVLVKMVSMAETLGARATGHDGVVYVDSSSSSSDSRRVIPRAGASLLLSIGGLLLIGAAVALRVGLSPGDAVISLEGSLLSVITLPLISVGIVALFVSVLFAVSSLFPWKRRCSKLAVMALLLDIIPLLFLR